MEAGLGESLAKNRILDVIIKIGLSSIYISFIHPKVTTEKYILSYDVCALSTKHLLT